MATSKPTQAAPFQGINDALNAEKDREFKRLIEQQLGKLLQSVEFLTTQVHELKQMRPLPAPTYQAAQTVKPADDEPKAASKKAKE